MTADDTKPDMPGSARHVYGPRPVAALVPGLTRAAFRRRAPAATQVMTDWPAIVGPALARVTTPRRLQGGTLSVACGGPVAMELQHLAGELIARINATIGRPLVERLRFVQDLQPPPAPSPPPPAPSPARAAAIDRTVGDLPPGDLRDALARLGLALSAEQSTAPKPKRPACD